MATRQFAERASGTIGKSTLFATLFVITFLAPFLTLLLPLGLPDAGTALLLFPFVWTVERFGLLLSESCGGFGCVAVVVFALYVLYALLVARVATAVVWYGLQWRR
ncbi:hypothetical protein [Natronolimnohabitans innermongolicus]|uniref:Uncharacterized protein n=1 Tax=Natronolimnohabitans innermongolicus JCM 12255 TaxID=1227499 RepID=L9XGY2_9EURY|nr:hypothetical protein [Natronolimnohabitans innermongolicus]ELY60666.1 hypothetical protein C493_04296 [Natronolimnohabitans innermongolicus JCM 12255]